jgi:hypothetical protein
VIDNQVIQADLVAWLKTQASLTSLLANATEVREDQYQGTVFLYPNVRLAMGIQVPITESGQCDLARLTFSIRAYAEGGSSKVADTIAGAAHRLLHRKQFKGTGWSSWFYGAGLDSATRTSEKLWRAEASFMGVVYPA